MRLAFELFRILSIVAFLWFGIQSLAFFGMNEEFKRFGMSRFRKLVGTLEIAGAIGLMASYWHPKTGVVSATALAALMLTALIIRLNVDGSNWSMAPAIIFMLMNTYIALNISAQLG